MDKLENLVTNIDPLEPPKIIIVKISVDKSVIGAKTLVPFFWMF